MSDLSEKRNLDQEGVAPEGRKYLYDFDKRMYSYILRTLTPFFRTGSTLELGCYKGDFTELLSVVFSDLTALDGSPEAAEACVARMRLRADVRCGRIEETTFERKFDNIFLMHVLEHTEDPIVVLKSVREMLSDEGRLFIVVPNAHAASRRLAVHMGILEQPKDVAAWERAVGHRRTYALDTLEADAHCAGLAVEERGGIFFKPLANKQFDALEGGDIVVEKYREACYELGKEYPDLCASIFLVCGKKK